MQSPAGLHCGLPSLSPHSVSRRGASPSSENRQRLDCVALRAMSWRLTLATAAAPLGLSDGAPMRARRHRASASKACGLRLMGQGLG